MINRAVEDDINHEKVGTAGAGLHPTCSTTTNFTPENYGTAQDTKTFSSQIYVIFNQMKNIPDNLCKLTV